MKTILLSAAALAALLSAPVAMAQDQNDKPKAEHVQRDNDKVQDHGDRMNGPDRGTMAGPKDNDRDHMNDRDVHKRVVVHKTVDRGTIMKFRANINAPRHFHIRAYVKPPGWYSHRWVFGERLPRAFFAPEFVITDYAAYDLMAPWDGYEWVRYGDDALLIDVDTGEVIRVEYGLFD